MPFVLFLIFTFTIAPLIIWGITHEDMLIKIEDKIIEDIRSQMAENRRNKKIRVIKNEKKTPSKICEDGNTPKECVA